MDPALLRLYNDELAYLRELGGEFAQQFPKIAARLSLDGIEVADPYVERLLEGFAFLAARVRLKLDAEYPRLVAHLLETVYPGFLAPVPSMALMRLQPDLQDPGLARGAVVPRGSRIVSEIARGQDTHCEFRTAHELTVWPLEVVQVQCFTLAADLPVAQLPVARDVRSGLRIRLKLHGGLRFDQLPLDRLMLHLAGPDDVAWRLHELVGGATLGSWLLPADGAAASAGMSAWRDAASVSASGFDDDQALLPETPRGFSGYRLVQELAAFPHRYLFVEVRDLATRCARLSTSTADLVILFHRADDGLAARVDAGSVALNCTPAINLFPKRLDRITTSPATWEYHAVPDRARPMDFEVHSIESITGYGTGNTAEQTFRPLYSPVPGRAAGHPAWFTLRREPRLLSPRQQQHGTRSAYIGSEVFVSLVDPRSAPYSQEIRQASVAAWVTNRDLPTLLPVAGASGSAAGAGRAGSWRLDGGAGVHAVECLRGPTRPLQRHAAGDAGWALVSQLALNHLSIAGEEPARAAAALRTMLELYGPDGDASWSRQVEGLVSVRAALVTRRLPMPGPLSVGCGVQVELDVDEFAFQGASAFLLGSVLERFLARHAAINSFTQTVLRSTTRGVLMRWPPRIGQAALL